MLKKNYIFVHIPKSAGSTLKVSIKSIIEADDIIWDYSHPFSQGRIARNVKNTIESFSTKKYQRKVIFGHFMPCKYADLSFSGFNKRENSIYLTFLRDPLQRAISHYYHWKREPDLTNSACVTLLEEDWSLERFLVDPFFKNFYAQFFFGFNINNFDFIGITERFDESIALLKMAYPEFSMLNVKENVNINTQKVVDKAYVIDPDLALIFKKNNVLDYAIYEQALAVFNNKHSQLMMKNS